MRITVISMVICAAMMLRAQEPSGPATAKAMDQEIFKLEDLSDNIRAQAIKDLALRIRQQPKQYAIHLAFDLAASATEGSAPDILQEVTTTLADSLRDLPIQDNHYEGAFQELAELARYSHMQVSLDDPRYTAELSKLEADDRHRGDIDFTLTDVQGQQWNLKSLRGKVVLVNFWATWCVPCRREIPDLSALYNRFKDRGFVVLAIADDEPSTLKQFLAQQTVTYPVLPDPGQSVEKLFLVTAIPKSFVYDRNGHLVAEAIDRPTMQGFLEMLGETGLR